MRTLKTFLWAAGLFFCQFVLGSAPDTIIIVESTQPQWAAGTIDSLNASTDTLRLDTVRTYHFTFTNCGQTGRFGPSQAMCNSSYTGTDLAGVVTVVDTGIQQWQTPEGGIYRIMAAGAGTNADSFLQGAIVQADFELAKSDTFNILVGQMGGSPRGGSGGTFVTYSDTAPLIIAGGAAGFRAYADAASRGSTATSGQSVTGPGCSAAGGIAGQGGQALGGGVCSGAGAGLYGDGQGCGGGLAFIHGGDGGNSTYLGGFGGGGGVSTSSSPGGGGGYSGGSVDYTGGTQSCAGGGGSYIDSIAANVITSDGYYNNSNTFIGDTIGSFGGWHTGQGMVVMQADKYVTVGNRISPVYNISTPATTLYSSVVDWRANTFTGTTVVVEIRYSTDGGSTWSAWSQVASSGSPIPGLLPGTAMDSTRLQTRITLATTALFASPQVYSITVTVINDSLPTGIMKYPDGLAGLRIYPNPFENTFKVNYTLSKQSDVGLRLFSMLGQATVVQEKNLQSAGQHSLEVNTSALHLSPGIYWIELQIDGQTCREKLVRY